MYLSLNYFVFTVGYNELRWNLRKITSLHSFHFGFHYTQFKMKIPKRNPLKYGTWCIVEF